MVKLTIETRAQEHYGDSVEELLHTLQNTETTPEYYAQITVRTEKTVAYNLDEAVRKATASLLKR